jgi:hypothetical protein
VAEVVRDLPLPALAAPLPREPRDPDRLRELSVQWGVSRQIGDLRSALGRQTDDE